MDLGYHHLDPFAELTYQDMILFLKGYEVSSSKKTFLHLPLRDK